MFKIIDLLEAEPGLKSRFLIPKLVLLSTDHSCQSPLTPLALSLPICKIRSRFRLDDLRF